MSSNAPDDWLRSGAARTPDRAALVTDRRDYTFADLDHAVDALATALPCGERVLGAVLAHAETLLLLTLAGFRAGQTIFPVNPRLTDDAVQTRLAAAGVRCAFSERALAGLRTIRPGTPAEREGDFSPHPLKASDVHLIIATSGSSGPPKGVMLSGANLAAAARASRSRLPLGPGDCWLGCMPLYAIGGLSIPLRCLESGATCRLTNGFDAAAVADLLAYGGISHVSLVPAMLAALLDLKVKPGAALRFVLVGGAALSQSLAERALRQGWPILPTYGMSETASQTATFTGDVGTWRPGLAGLPLPGLDVTIGDSGRIRVKGPSVMAGYANPDLRPGDGLDAEGWFETGDLGRIDEVGRLEVLGRADDVLISGGINIHPLEVEHLVSRCDGISAVAVTGRDDPVWGEKLVAVYVGSIEVEAFLAWCREALPSPIRPRAAVRVTALPALPSGKLDRPALRRLAQN